MSPSADGGEKSSQVLMKKYVFLLVILIILIVLFAIAFFLGMRYSASRTTEKVVKENVTKTTALPPSTEFYVSSEETSSSEESPSPTITQDKIRIEEPCPDKYHYFPATRSCYFISEERCKVVEAKYLCDVDDAKLTSIHSDEENFFLEGIERRKWGIVGIWLGMERIQGQWRNHDGTETDYIMFANESDEGDCVMMLGRSDQLALSEGQRPGGLRNWLRADCELEKRFSCKKPSYRRNEDEKLSKLKSKGIEQGPCERGWYYFNKTGACYTVRKNANFSDAQKGCEGENASLTSVHSEEENQFILDIAEFRSYWESNEIWIGVKRKDRSSINLDGSPMDYTNWAYENFLTFGECAQIYGQSYAGHYGEWNMFSCDYPQRYVCKKRL